MTDDIPTTPPTEPPPRESEAPKKSREPNRRQFLRRFLIGAGVAAAAGAGVFELLSGEEDGVELTNDNRKHDRAGSPSVNEAMLGMQSKPLPQLGDSIILKLTGSDACENLSQITLSPTTLILDYKDGSQKTVNLPLEQPAGRFTHIDLVFDPAVCMPGANVPKVKLVGSPTRNLSIMVGAPKSYPLYQPLNVDVAKASLGTVRVMNNYGPAMDVVGLNKKELLKAQYAKLQRAMPIKLNPLLDIYLHPHNPTTFHCGDDKVTRCYSELSQTRTP